MRVEDIIDAAAEAGVSMPQDWPLWAEDDLPEERECYDPMGAIRSDDRRLRS